MPLTDAQYSALRAGLYQKGNGKEELKSLPNLPDKAQLRAAFQVLDDFWDASRVQLRNDIVVALGSPTAPGPTLNNLARKIGRAWLQSMFGRGG
jgi:hypothetical protein